MLMRELAGVLHGRLRQCDALGGVPGENPEYLCLQNKEEVDL